MSERHQFIKRATGWLNLCFFLRQPRRTCIDDQISSRDMVSLQPSQAGYHELPEHFGGLGIVTVHLGLCMLVPCHPSDDRTAFCVPSGEHRMPTCIGNCVFAINREFARFSRKFFRGSSATKGSAPRSRSTMRIHPQRSFGTGTGLAVESRDAKDSEIRGRRVCFIHFERASRNRKSDAAEVTELEGCLSCPRCCSVHNLRPSGNRQEH